MLSPRRLPPSSASGLRRLAPVLVLLLLPLTLLHRPLLHGEAFVPADLLGYVAPFQGPPGATPKSAWNVLRYDGITQFYPWRLQAARAVRAGRVPLWNPYQFGFAGGTPLLANSQSAPLYPPNVLFYLLGPRHVWAAFGLSAALHLLIAATGMYRFLRGVIRVGRLPALLGATTWTLSGPVVTWLALPTFLGVSCWLPWLLLLVRRAHERAGTRDGRLAALGAGTVAGTLLLAGHLQVAFYCLLAAGAYAAWLGVRGWRAERVRPVRWLAAVAGAGALAACLCAPQLLPTLELSRVSHRTGGASEAGYAAYSDTALPARNLVTLLAPGFFGDPNAGTYWNLVGQTRSPVNYAELALYVGVAPLLLAAYALALPGWRRASDLFLEDRPFFAALALLALLMALGTTVNRVFYFGVPGFAQTGSPARSLLLLAFSLSLLAGMGLEALLRVSATNAQRRRASLIAVAGPLFVVAAGASLAARFAGEDYPAGTFATLVAPALPGMLKAGALLVAGAGMLWLLAARRMTERARGLAAAALVALAAGDLLAWGVNYNPSAAPGAVYPETPGIRWLQANAPNALIAPLNRDWSLGGLGNDAPRFAALPPNALTVYGLHDVAGYDSLFPGAYKRRVRDAGGGEDPSPPENGNLVFIKRAETALRLGARYLVTAPGVPDLTAGNGAIAALPLRRVYAEPDLTIYENRATGADFDEAAGARAYGAPASFRIGLFAGLGALAVLAAAMTGSGAATRKRPAKP